ncbi:hypothetical protein FB451DRAFT_1050022, partial [Mycena latifolia]
HYKYVAATSSDPEYVDQIAAKKGVRAAPVDKVPAWWPALCSPSEIMHMIYLRLASVIHEDILLGGGMFNSSRDMEETPLKRFDDFLDSLWWPADVGRVRSRLGTGGGRVKADEWRNTMLVYPVALFEAWRVGDAIPDTDAPLPKARSRAKASEEHAADLFLLGLTPLPATPNFHLSTHTDLFIWAFGPGYAWWVFPFERHLGRLGRFKTNGHTGGELEATMMRSWWKSIYCQDLVSAMLIVSFGNGTHFSRSRCSKTNLIARPKTILLFKYSSMG